VKAQSSKLKAQEKLQASSSGRSGATGLALGGGLPHCGLELWNWRDESETRNPKPEIRKKFEARNPEKKAGAVDLLFRPSDFGLLSDFGFQISDLTPDWQPRFHDRLGSLLETLRFSPGNSRRDLRLVPAATTFPSVTP
jgi:hypothetical protein